MAATEPQRLGASVRRLSLTALARSRTVAVTAGLAGVTASVRSIIGLAEAVRYWDPVTPLDYATVVLSSVVFLLLGASLWALASLWRLTDGDGVGLKVSRVVGRVAAVSAMTVSLVNFLEDALRVRWLGGVFVSGMLLLTFCLMSAAVARFASAPRRNLTEALLLFIAAAGLMLLSIAFTTAAALLVFAFYYGWLRPGTSHDPPRSMPATRNSWGRMGSCAADT